MTAPDPPPSGHGDHPNAALLRRLYDLLAAGDIDGYLALVADDAVFHVGGDSIVAGEYAGKDAIVE